mmetsp:Transcript_21575/g.62013  ORF Transcript_21575/g.62013 Transcript_21575/m.62013 type:complete len:207 (+) Transcript_21575:1112-1732(+)
MGVLGGADHLYLPQLHDHVVHVRSRTAWVHHLSGGFGAAELRSCCGNSYLVARSGVGACLLHQPCRFVMQLGRVPVLLVEQARRARLALRVRRIRHSGRAVGLWLPRLVRGGRRSQTAEPEREARQGGRRARLLHDESGDLLRAGVVAFFRGLVLRKGVPLGQLPQRGGVFSRTSHGAAGREDRGDGRLMAQRLLSTPIHGLPGGT